MSRNLTVVLGGGCEIGHGGGGEAAHPEERLDLAVLEGVDAFGGAEPLLGDVFGAVEARRLQHAEGEHLRGAAGRARRDALALEVLDLGDPRTLHGDGVHVVWIEHRERAHGQLGGELVAAGVDVEGCVDLREADVGPAGGDELQVVDGGARDLGGRGGVRQFPAEQIGETAAERIVHAPRAAGPDDQLARVLRAGRGGEPEG